MCYTHWYWLTVYYGGAFPVYAEFVREWGAMGWEVGLLQIYAGEFHPLFTDSCSLFFGFSSFFPWVVLQLQKMPLFAAMIFFKDR